MRPIWLLQANDQCFVCFIDQYDTIININMPVEEKFYSFQMDLFVVALTCDDVGQKQGCGSGCFGRIRISKKRSDLDPV